jgi:ribosomal protein S27AE
MVKKKNVNSDLSECPNCGSTATEVKVFDYGQYLVCSKCSVIRAKFAW